jgi:hypothetical protein
LIAEEARAMTRFFYAAVAAVLISISIESALAVTLSPSFADAASAPRFDDSATKNLGNLPTPTPTVGERVFADCESTVTTVAGAPAMPPRRTYHASGNADGTTSFTQSATDSGSLMDQGSQTVNCHRR